MNELEKKIISIMNSKSYINYNNYHSNNILSIIGVARIEDIHSIFIEWLLGMHEVEDLGSFPLQHFIRSLKFVKMREENIYSRIDIDVIDKFSDKGFITDIIVEREINRVDLIVYAFTKEKILPILIENKVNYHEHDNQTTKYFNFGEKEFNNREKYFEPIYVFLSPLYNYTKPEKKEYLSMSYQDLVDYVIDPSYSRCENDEVKYSIKCYLQCLSYLNEYVEGNGVMAISSEEKRIIEEFIKENENLLYNVFDELKDYENRELVEKICKSSKNNDNFLFNNEYYKKGRLVQAIVKQYCIDHPNVTFEELDKEFYGLGDNHGVVRLKEQLIEKYKNLKDDISKRYFAKEEDYIILSNGDIVLVNSQWTDNYINPFIEKAKSLGYEIERITVNE